MSRNETDGLNAGVCGYVVRSALSVYCSSTKLHNTKQFLNTNLLQISDYVGWAAGQA